MADTPTPPLNANSPIVDPSSGKPKPPFILLINQLLKGSVANAAAIAQQALDAAKAATAAVAALKKTKIVAGVGLDGGGPISADVTLNLEDTAVTPDTYGDGTHVPQITVDQQGRITGVVDIVITGGGGGGGGGTPPTLRGTDIVDVNNANNVTVPFPTGTIAGDLAIVAANHAWNINTPAGWTSLSNLAGSNTNGGCFYKYLDAADITAGSINFSFGGTYYGVAAIATYDSAGIQSITLVHDERTSGGLANAPFTATGGETYYSYFIYGGTRDNGLVTFDIAAVAETFNNSDRSAALGIYTPTTGGAIAEVINWAASGGGTYGVSVVIKGTPGSVPEAPNDGQMYARQSLAWTPFTPGSGGGGGGGGGGAPATAQYWRYRTLHPSLGHSSDGTGFTGINFRDAGGTALVGTGTPFASNTDGSWNLAQAFDGITSSGHGWYSSNGGDGSFAVVGYDFGAPVTPARFEFAPLHDYTWSVPLYLAVENSQDGEEYQTVLLLNPRTAVGGVVESYDLPAPTAEPSIVQLATLRDDGTVTLPTAPTVGNMMIFVSGGWNGSIYGYAPAGFTLIDAAEVSSNAVLIWFRIVQTGDTGSYAVSGSDNQACVLYEFADAKTIARLQGGNMYPAFSGTNWALSVVDSLSPGIRLFACEQDTTLNWGIDPASGLTVDFYGDTSGGNHTSAFASLTGAFGGFMTGTLAGGPTNPVFGIWAVM
jgi:hypothetical protein